MLMSFAIQAGILLRTKWSFPSRKSTSSDWPWATTTGGEDTGLAAAVGVAAATQQTQTPVGMQIFWHRILTMRTRNNASFHMQWAWTTPLLRLQCTTNTPHWTGQDDTLLKMGSTCTTIWCQYWDYRLIYWAVYRLFYWHVPIVTHCCAIVTTHF